MSLVKSFRTMFSGRRKPTLAEVDPETLRRERIKVEQNETRLTREIEELEKQKEQFFRKGVEGGSDRQRLQVARKIKEIDGLIQAKDRQLTLISKNLRVLNGIAQLKENQRLLVELGVDGLLSQMDMDEVQAYIEKATVEGQFHMERFTGLLNSIDDAEGLYRMDAEDADTRAILEAMDAAAASRTDESISHGLEQMNEALHRERPEANA